MLYSNWKLEKAKRNSNKFVKISLTFTKTPGCSQKQIC